MTTASTSTPPDPRQAIGFLNDRVGRLTQELFEAYVERQQLQARNDELEELLEQMQGTIGPQPTTAPHA